MKDKITIKEVSELLGISTDAIRLYEKEGLIKPYRDPNNGYRFYDLALVQRIMAIILYRRLNASIKDIDSILNSDSLEKLITECASLQETNRQKMAELEETNFKLMHLQSHIATLLEGLNKCQIKELSRIYTPIVHEEDMDIYETMWDEGHSPYFSYGNDCYIFEQDEKSGLHSVAHMYALREEILSVSPLIHTIDSIPFREEGSCVYQVVCEEEVMHNSNYLERMREYAKEHGYQYKNYVYCFYIISVQSKNGPLNYYELYLPIYK